MWNLLLKKEARYYAGRGKTSHWIFLKRTQRYIGIVSQLEKLTRSAIQFLVVSLFHVQQHLEIIDSIFTVNLCSGYSRARLLLNYLRKYIVKGLPVRYWLPKHVMLNGYDYKKLRSLFLLYRWKHNQGIVYMC